MHRPKVEFVVIGGGIVGLATAFRATERFPGRKIVVLDKEQTIARHQTGHNSGVLHTGIYYRPGSLRASNCRDGKLAMEVFCEREDIPFERCGKVIVATGEDELPRLKTLLERGRANDVRCELVGPGRLREIEPHAAGLAAIHVPEAGIVNYAAVCERLAERVREAGGEIRLGTRVTGIRTGSGSVVVSTTNEDIEAVVAVNCGGLHSDRLATLSGAKISAKIVPFRGEYYKLRPDAERLVKGLIYPVPDPRFPFLGVHFTKMIDGGVECGPNAVLAFAREGYTKTAVNIVDLFESLSYPGFLRMAARHWRTGFGEMWRSLSKAAFVRALQRMVPEVRPEQLEAAPAGVRAQALGRDGTLVDDFVIESSDRVINVLNAPSPAATSSLNIGTMISDRVASRLE
ncbi:MAG: L-2-hydroxyglutarate oxidase [Planctomycetota bacterium]|nr:L-2-hydroxyglutarate oxidase [Planctomycetota bacterium]